jgi:hypothetical protein
MHPNYANGGLIGFGHSEITSTRINSIPLLVKFRLSHKSCKIAPMEGSNCEEELAYTQKLEPSSGEPSTVVEKHADPPLTIPDAAPPVATDVAEETTRRDHCDRY